MTYIVEYTEFGRRSSVEHYQKNTVLKSIEELTERGVEWSVLEKRVIMVDGETIPTKEEFIKMIKEMPLTGALGIACRTKGCTSEIAWLEGSLRYLYDKLTTEPCLKCHRQSWYTFRDLVGFED